MIMYEFRCCNCSKPFTLNLSYSSYLAMLTYECPHCGSHNVERVIGTTPVHFKGKGFTKTAKEEE